jgi:hypothetical protein
MQHDKLPQYAYKLFDMFVIIAHAQNLALQIAAGTRGKYYMCHYTHIGTSFDQKTLETTHQNKQSLAN